MRKILLLENHANSYTKCQLATFCATVFILKHRKLAVLTARRLYIDFVFVRFAPFSTLGWVQLPICTHSTECDWETEKYGEGDGYNRLKPPT